MSSTEADPPGATDPLDPVERIMAELYELSEPDLPAGIDRALAKYPEHAGELRRRLASLRPLEQAARGPGVSGTVPGIPDVLGDFRIGERLGGGGMGVVYRATQLSLKREVALKVVRPELLYLGGARERFRRETEVVARLQHPGIVTIHTVGEESGLPFFAMELLRGRTLAEVLASLSVRAPESLRAGDLLGPGRGGAAAGAALFRGSWVDGCLRVVTALADALEHAHGRGILHRDVKPSNAMVLDDGRVVLLDFGLTSFLAGADASITRSGSPVGTPAYMSPEQVRGRDLDARTDVYGLGATLYELLALQPPFRADGLFAVQELILRGQADSIRARNRAVPRDVALVCRKAMSARRGDRYPGTAELAADLRRALERRPILARRPGPLVRSLRWTQRHPARFCALLVSTLLLGGLPTGLWLQQRAHAVQLGAALDREEAARAQAQTERSRADERALEAEDVLAFLTSLFRKATPEEAQGERIDVRDLLDEGAHRIEDELATRPRVRARIQAVIADAYDQLSLFAEGLPLADRAVSGLRERADGDARAQLATALRVRGSLLLGLGRLDESEQDLRAALRLAEAEHGSRSRHVNPYRKHLGMLLVTNGGDLEVVALMRRSLDALLVDPESSSQGLLDTWRLLATAHLNLRQLDLAEAALGEALARAQGEELAPRRVALHNQLGYLARLRGRHDEAQAQYESALAIAEELWGPDSAYPWTVRLNLAGLGHARGELEEAATAYAQVAEGIERFHGPEHPNVAVSLGNRAGVLHELGRFAEAAELYEEVIPLQARVFGPGHRFLLTSHRNLGHCLEELGLPNEALECYRRGLSALPEGGYAQRDADAVLAELAGMAAACRRLGDAELGEEIERRARVLGAREERNAGDFR